MQSELPNNMDHLSVMNPRFALKSDDELRQLSDKLDKPNTVKAYNMFKELFIDFFKQLNISNEQRFKSLTKSEILEIALKFLGSARTKSGELFSRSSFRLLFC